VGLGSAVKVDAVRVHWPDGRSEEWKDPSVDRYTTWREGAAPQKK